MATKDNWFFSTFCTRCFDSKTEAKNEIIFIPDNPRQSPKERNLTIKYSLKPLPISTVRSDSNEIKSFSSTKDNTTFVSETRLVRAETSANSPRYDLELEVVESDYLEVGKKFRIKSGGFVDNTPAINATEVYFGTEFENTSQKQESVNDIVCSKFKSGKPIQSARVLIDKGVFSLEDRGGGDGVYIKAEDKIALEDQTIVYYGIGHFLVHTLKSKDGSAKPRLKLKFLDGPSEGQEKVLESEEFCTIGRLSTCTIPFNEYGVSRIQCKLFIENGQWYIKDGDGFKKSTNGTWLLVNKKTSISTKMAFKVNNTVFRASLIEV